MTTLKQLRAEMGARGVKKIDLNPEFVARFHHRRGALQDCGMELAGMITRWTPAQGDVFLALIAFAQRGCMTMELRYNEPEDCFTCEMHELGVVPEKTLHIKRCYDLGMFYEKCLSKWPEYKP